MAQQIELRVDAKDQVPKDGELVDKLVIEFGNQRGMFNKGKVDEKNETYDQDFTKWVSILNRFRRLKELSFESKMIRSSLIRFMTSWVRTRESQSQYLKVFDVLKQIESFTIKDLSYKFDHTFWPQNIVLKPNNIRHLFYSMRSLRHLDMQGLEFGIEQEWLHKCPLLDTVKIQLPNRRNGFTIPDFLNPVDLTVYVRQYVPFLELNSTPRHVNIILEKQSSIDIVMKDGQQPIPYTITTVEGESQTADSLYKPEQLKSPSPIIPITRPHFTLENMNADYLNLDPVEKKSEDTFHIKQQTSTNSDVTFERGYSPLTRAVPRHELVAKGLSAGIAIKNLDRDPVIPSAASMANRDNPAIQDHSRHFATLPSLAARMNVSNRIKSMIPGVGNLVPAHPVKGPLQGAFASAASAASGASASSAAFAQPQTIQRRQIKREESAEDRAKSREKMYATFNIPKRNDPVSSSLDALRARLMAKFQQTPQPNAPSASASSMARPIPAPFNTTAAQAPYSSISDAASASAYPEPRHFQHPWKTIVQYPQLAQLKEEVAPEYTVQFNPFWNAAWLAIGDMCIKNVVGIETSNLHMQLLYRKTDQLGRSIFSIETHGLDEKDGLGKNFERLTLRLQKLFKTRFPSLQVEFYYNSHTIMIFVGRLQIDDAKQSTLRLLDPHREIVFGALLFLCSSFILHIDGWVNIRAYNQLYQVQQEATWDLASFLEFWTSAKIAIPEMDAMMVWKLPILKLAPMTELQKLFAPMLQKKASV